MRSCPIRLEPITDPDNLREAFLRAALGKGERGDLIAFRENLEAEWPRERGHVKDDMGALSGAE